jgi:Xaa-Pro dipeptidase
MTSDPARFRPRLDRLRRFVSEHGADAMLIDHAELLAWISGYTVSETLYRAVLVPLDGDPVFVLRSIDGAPCRAGVWFTDVRTFDDHENPHEAVAAAVVARGLGRSRIAVDTASYGFSAATRDSLAVALPHVDFVALPGASDSLRAVKFSDEMERIGAAAAIADEVMAELVAFTRPGLKVREVAAEAAAGLLRHGADDGGPGPILAAAGDMDFLHGQGLDRLLRPGDVLHVELTPRVENYGARLMRPIFVGEPSPQRLRTLATLIELQDRQIAAMTPGAMAADVDRILRHGVLAAGLRAAYGNVTGYTMGLYARTPRPSDFSLSFHPGAAFRLEQNQVFHMYTSAGGIAVSETVAVSPDGGRRLTRYPRQSLVKPFRSSAK